MRLLSTSLHWRAPHTSGVAEMHTLLMQWTQIFKTPRGHQVCSCTSRELPRDHGVALILCNFMRNTQALHETTRAGRAVKETADRYVSNSWKWWWQQMDRNGRYKRERVSWWWMGRQREGRRRAMIRTKTSVTFRGFSLLPYESGPWSKPHRLYCVVVCVALCLCGPASGDCANHDSAEIEPHRTEWSTASLFERISLRSHLPPFRAQ